MLSEPEQRALDAIAAGLQAEDPDLCRRLTEPVDRKLITRRRWLFAGAAGSATLGALTAVLGALALSLGLVFLGCLVTAITWGAYVLLRNAPVQQQPDGSTTEGWTWA